MKSAVVLHCVRCGKPVVLSQLSTTAADINGEQLHQMMRAVASKALCKDCEARRHYYIGVGRLEDWEAGRP